MLFRSSGYHGWCDWYLATNLGDENKLKEHLLPGLDPKGVPVGLKSTALPFRYNDVADLERLAQTEDFGVIVLEGARYDFPKPDFIAAVHRVAKQKNAIIVLDEITSGWRMTDGGVYKLQNFIGGKRHHYFMLPGKGGLCEGWPVRQLPSGDFSAIGTDVNANMG